MLDWDGISERRNPGDEMKNIYNQISLLKKEQEDSLGKIQSSINELTKQLFPHDGSDGVVQRIKNLEKEEDRRRKEHENVMKIAIGSVTALVITIASWLGKFIVTFMK